MKAKIVTVDYHTYIIDRECRIATTTNDRGMRHVIVAAKGKAFPDTPRNRNKRIPTPVLSEAERAYAKREQNGHFGAGIVYDGETRAQAERRHEKRRIETVRTTWDVTPRHDIVATPDKRREYALRKAGLI